MIDKPCENQFKYNVGDVLYTPIFNITRANHLNHPKQYIKVIVLKQRHSGYNQGRFYTLLSTDTQAQISAREWILFTYEEIVTARLADMSIETMKQRFHTRLYEEAQVRK